jgi:hypothetical protein
MQIRRSQKNVQARFGGRFQGAQRGFNIFQAGASQSRNATRGDCRSDCANRIEIARRGDRKTCFEYVHAENFQLAGELQFFGAVHGEAGRLFAVAKRGVKDMNLIQASSFGWSQYFAV